MNHKQILEKLSHKRLVAALTDELSAVVRAVMLAETPATAMNRCDEVHRRMMSRWQCLRNHYGHEDVVVRCFDVAYATLLHKFGLYREDITARAIRSLQGLNQTVALSDAFARQEPAMIALLTHSPLPLKKRPAFREPITFYRPKDVVVFEYQQVFIAAYIHQDMGVNEAPILEFFDAVFDGVPAVRDVQCLPAYGEWAGQATPKRYRAYFAVAGMTYCPDLAEQITLIGANSEVKPDSTGLEPPLGQYQLTRIDLIQTVLQRLYQAHRG